MTPPKATVLIPTWNAPKSLGPAIDSALAQTVDDIEVLVVLDGANSQTKTVARAHSVRDRRVRVLDLAKAPSRGEANRHRGVLAASAPIVAYLADDDLLMPRHLENLLPMFSDYDLVQSLNSWIDAAGELHLLVAELSRPEWREFHLLNPPLNRISITGTAHTIKAYEKLEQGWVVPEPGIAADLTLWRQFLADPAVRAATHPEITTLQFPAPTRRGRTTAEIAAVRDHWEQFVQDPESHDRLQQIGARAALRDLLESSLDVRALTVARERDQAQIAALSAELDKHRARLSWRMTGPLRAALARIRKVHHPL